MIGFQIMCLVLLKNLYHRYYNLYRKNKSITKEEFALGLVLPFGLEMVSMLEMVLPSDLVLRLVLVLLLGLVLQLGLVLPLD